jgi:hypothetical protein
LAAAASVEVIVFVRSKSGDKLARSRGRRLPLGGLHEIRPGVLGRVPTAVEMSRVETPVVEAPVVELAMVETPMVEMPAARGAAVQGAPLVLDHAGVTQDRATYTCACGFVFQAHVLTTVSCPNCHTDQAW